MKNVVVIGAGVVGITTAYFLRQHGMDVTLLESGNEPARGASYASGGLYQASAPDPWNAPGAIKMFLTAWSNYLMGRGDSSAFSARTLTLPGLMGWGIRFLRNANEKTFLSHVIKNRRLAHYTLDVVERLNETENLDYCWSKKGSLFVCRDAQSLESFVGFAEFVASDGARFEALDRNALLAKESSLDEIGDQIEGAVHFPDDQAGNSQAFCEQLAEIADQNRVTIHYGAPALGITKAGTGVRVRVPDGDLEADAVVVAAGARSKELLKPLGIHLPIVPAIGYSICVPMHGWTNRPTHVIADMGPHAGVNPMGDTLKVAGVAEFAGMKQGVSEKRTEYLIGLMRQMFPSFADTVTMDEVDPRIGHRSLCADGIPIVGATPAKGVYVNTGHGGLGWTQAPGSSKALADLIARVDSRFDLDDYSVSRFA